MLDKINVNDRTRQGCAYCLTRSEGKAFDANLQPKLTPAE
jgi:hypothetical protein